MGFGNEKATLALAATGGKSVEKAAEWLLGETKVEPTDKRTRFETITKPPKEADHVSKTIEAFFKMSPRCRKRNLNDGTFACNQEQGSEQQQSNPVEQYAAQGGTSFDQTKYSSQGPPEAIATKRLKLAREDHVGSDDKAAVASQCGRRVLAASEYSIEPDSRPAGQHIAELSSGPHNPHTPSHKFPPPESEPRALGRAGLGPDAGTFGQLFDRSKTSPAAAKPHSKHIRSTPLAERMRPERIEDIVGQEHLLAKGCMLRALIDGDSVQSLILWGPPGSGKTTLARAIAQRVSHRYVALSAVTSGVKELREVVEEARRARRLRQQRTLLFVDEVHRFHKGQQDAFLPHLEAGDVVLVGATTENPSFELTSALLSRCRVFTLSKLESCDIVRVLRRAVGDSRRGLCVGREDALPAQVVAEEALEFLAAAADGDARVALGALEMAFEAVLSALKSAAAGRARPPEAAAGPQSRAAEMRGETGCEAASSDDLLEDTGGGCGRMSQPADEPRSTPTYAQETGGQRVEMQEEKDTRAGTATMTATAAESAEVRDGEEKRRAGPAATATTVAATVAAATGGSRPPPLVGLRDVQEAFQRSHVLYDKTGEEHYNIISALHKAMRGGDPDAALYWLARMLEGGEGPLYVARRLVRFASEDVGLADPLALPLAVAAFQACQLIGMPECDVNLAHCAAYLAMAPKSVAVYRAVKEARRVVKETGQNEPVPLYLRNAPTRLMKGLGYGKGYIYPPDHEGPVEQEYMPPSLRGRKFLQL
eukprot:jgi/Mesen1/1103/ME000123S00269